MAAGLLQKAVDLCQHLFGLAGAITLAVVRNLAGQVDEIAVEHGATEARGAGDTLDMHGKLLSISESCSWEDSSLPARSGFCARKSGMKAPGHWHRPE